MQADESLWYRHESSLFLISQPRSQPRNRSLCPDSQGRPTKAVVVSPRQCFGFCQEAGNGLTLLIFSITSIERNTVAGHRIASLTSCEEASSRMESKMRSRDQISWGRGQRPELILSTIIYIYIYIYINILYNILSWEKKGKPLSIGHRITGLLIYTWTGGPATSS